MATLSVVPRTGPTAPTGGVPARSVPARRPGAPDRRAAPAPLLREAVGQVLRAERVARRERLVDVAAAASISPQYLSEIERGLKDPSSEVLRSLSGALGLPAAEVVRRAGARMAGPARVTLSARAVAPVRTARPTQTSRPAHTNLSAGMSRPAHMNLSAAMGLPAGINLPVLAGLPAPRGLPAPASLPVPTQAVRPPSAAHRLAA
ncbi:helix-turn-helix domain-containing protein [Georgenia sp. TF02-10]|uniref:helix-turn-helix domain-containing protein n=1 Tax=Georgenia sp. TF02-10 TaxID=2917725 RepID=UPI001FA77631|nr:helix-turn-helix transcriptional regulator [Georgenia sp. TF02-10]UNX54643.1 helix-turn-helix domain-containing protein [Georgenia sp. TF02-10]